MKKAEFDTARHAFLPRLIAWEVTRSCPLACKHCRAGARNQPYEGELTTDEGVRLLENIASFSRPTIILTGGEPMLRDDIYELAACADGLGLGVVMAPCGMMVDDEAVARMKASGIRCISISIDGATAETHDAFRGVAGAFASAVKATEAAVRGGLDFQINTTITRHNRDQVEAIRDLAVRLGASVFNPFLLVPTGRGKELAGQEISPRQYEQTLEWLAEQHAKPDIAIRVTCAPHYARILRQRNPKARGANGCLGGKAFAFISHVGVVQICGFLEIECGDLKKENLDFKKIWETSEVFLQVRNVDAYGGKCGICEYRRICGGCRARAFAMTGDYLAEEPFCIYQPHQRA